MQTKLAMLLFFVLAILSCRSDFSSKSLSIATSFGKIVVMLKTLEEKSIEQRDLYFVYGTVTIDNSQERGIDIDLNDIVFTINGRDSESCYVDSVASYVSPLGVPKSEKKTLDVYWIFDRMAPLEMRDNPEITAHYRESRG